MAARLVNKFLLHKTFFEEKKLIYIHILHTIERYQIRLIERGGKITTEDIDLGSKRQV